VFFHTATQQQQQQQQQQAVRFHVTVDSWSALPLLLCVGALADLFRMSATAAVAHNALSEIQLTFKT
jgi:hypothetical protein